MEMQFFVKPGEDDKWFEYWMKKRMEWYERLGLNKNKLRFHEHGPDELAHYAKKAYDIEYQFPFDWQEIEGVHNRTDFDLSRHAEYSRKNMNYFDDESKEKYIPYVIETSIGCDRTVLTCLIDAYTEEEDRVVLKFAPSIAPIKAAVFPLVKKDGMPEMAKNIINELKGDYRVFYDESGAIGRRYRRQDEAGTPFCITIDNDTLTDKSVTIRHRDSMEQTRVSASKVKSYLAKHLIL